MTQKLKSQIRVSDVGSSFSMPVGPGINLVDSDSNKSRFRNLRSSCLRGERKGPNRERGLFESLFYLTDYSCFWVRCRPLKPVTGGKRLQGQRGNGLPPCTVERSNNGFADSKAAVVRQKKESGPMHSSRPQLEPPTKAKAVKRSMMSNCTPLKTVDTRFLTARKHLENYGNAH